MRRKKGTDDQDNDYRTDLRHPVCRSSVLEKVSLTCLLCGEQFTGPKAVRLKHGCIRHRKWGAEFLELPFEDNSKVKWICAECAVDHYLMDDTQREFSTRLEKIGLRGYCCLCNQDIEPYPNHDWSSAALIEIGTMEPSRKGAFSLFHKAHAGHVHYMCMDELSITLWRLIEQDDTPPDYGEYLPCK